MKRILAFCIILLSVSLFATTIYAKHDNHDGQSVLSENNYLNPSVLLPAATAGQTASSDKLIETFVYHWSGYGWHSHNSVVNLDLWEIKVHHGPIKHGKILNNPDFTKTITSQNPRKSCKYMMIDDPYTYYFNLPE